MASEANETLKCSGCGQAIAPRRGLPVCSSRCRKREWRARRRRERRRVCLECGGAFSGRVDAVYCSGICRQGAYRRRLAGRQAAKRAAIDLAAALIG